MTNCFNKNIPIYSDLTATFGVENMYYIGNLMETNKFKEWKGDSELPTYTNENSFILYSNDNKEWDLHSFLGITPSEEYLDELYNREYEEEVLPEPNNEMVNQFPIVVEPSKSFDEVNEILKNVEESHTLEEVVIDTLPNTTKKEKARIKKLKLLDLGKTGKIKLYRNINTGELEDRVSFAQSLNFITKKGVEKAAQMDSSEESKIAAEAGTLIHKFLQHSLSAVIGEFPNISIADHKINPEDEKLAKEAYKALGLNREMEGKLLDGLRILLLDIQKEAESLGTEAVLYPEQILSNGSLTGTSDLFVVYKGNGYGIFDYKAIAMSTFQEEEGVYVPKIDKKIVPAKYDSYNMQISTYSRIAKDDLGLGTPRQLRIIPINRVQKSVKNKGTGKWESSVKLNGIDMLDTAKSELLEMIPMKEYPKDEKIAVLVQKLYKELDAIHKQIETKPSTKLEVRAENVKKALQTLLVKKDYMQLIESLNNTLTYISANIDEISTDLELMQYYLAELDIYKNIVVDIEGLSAEDRPKVDDYLTDTKAYLAAVDEYNKRYVDIAGTIQLGREMLENAHDTYINSTEVTNRINNNVDDATGWLKKWFTGLSDFTAPVFQSVYKILSDIGGKIDRDVDKVAKEIKELTKNLKLSDYISMIDEVGKPIIVDGVVQTYKDGNIKMGRGNLKSKYDQKYYDEITMRQERKNKADIAWLRINIPFDKDKYKERYNEKKEMLIKLGTAKSVIEEEMASFQAKHNLEVSDTALLTEYSSMWFKKEPAPKWYSNFYKDMTNDQRAFYDYNVTKNKEFSEILRNRGIRVSGNFVANIRKDLVENMDWATIGSTFINSAKMVQDSITVRENDEAFGKANRMDDKGNFIYDIPVLFHGDWKLDNNEKTKDLGAALLLFSNTVYAYKYKSEVEPIITGLQNIATRNRVKSTNWYGKTVKRPDGTYESIETPNNAQTLMKYINLHLYGVQIQSKDAKVTVGEKDYSLTKVMDTLIRYMTLKDIGYNPISAIVNTASTVVNLAIIGSEGIAFTNSQMRGAGLQLMGLKKDGKGVDLDARAKSNNIAKFLDINRSIAMSARELSKSAVTDTSIARIGFYMMSRPEELHKAQLSLAMSKSFTYDTEKGKFRRKKEGEESFEDQIEQGEDGLLFNGVPIEDVISIEELNSFRETIKKTFARATGQTSELDRNLYRTEWLGRLLSTYRNWIPRTVEARFGGLRKDVLLDSYSVGRYRIIGNALEGSVAEFIAGNFASGMKELTSVLGAGIYMGITGGDGLYRKITGKNLVAIQDVKNSNFKRMYERNYAKFKQENPDKTDAELEEMFKEAVNGKIKSLAREIQVTGYIIMATFFAGMDDDDEDEDSYKKYFFKKGSIVMDKFMRELTFYYNPAELNQLIKSPVPLWRLAEDVQKLIMNTFDETVFDPFKGENSSQDKSPFGYYFASMTPIFNQFYKWGEAGKEAREALKPKEGEGGIQLVK